MPKHISTLIPRGLLAQQTFFPPAPGPLPSPQPTAPDPELDALNHHYFQSCRQHGIPLYETPWGLSASPPPSKTERPHD
jgi:hypothetical protein